MATNGQRKQCFGWFYAGVFSLAAVVGGLTGLSASPIVGVLMPLLFALLTAGGAIYVARESTGVPPESSRTRQERAGFMGRQLLVFSVAFALGLGVGIYGKYKITEEVRAARRAVPAYSALAFSDMRLLAAVIELDGRMIASGLDYETRRTIFAQLDTAIVARRKPNGLLGDEDATGATLAVPGVGKPRDYAGDDLFNPVATLQDVYPNLHIGPESYPMLLRQRLQPGEDKG